MWLRRWESLDSQSLCPIWLRCMDTRTIWTFLSLYFLHTSWTYIGVWQSSVSISVDKAGACVGPASPMGVMVTDTGIRQEWWLDYFMLRRKRSVAARVGPAFWWRPALFCSSLLGDSGIMYNLFFQPSWLPQFTGSLNGVTRHVSGPLGNLKLSLEEQKFSVEAIKDERVWPCLGWAWCSLVPTEESPSIASLSLGINIHFLLDDFQRWKSNLSWAACWIHFKFSLLYFERISNWAFSICDHMLPWGPSRPRGLYRLVLWAWFMATLRLCWPGIGLPDQHPNSTWKPIFWKGEWYPSCIPRTYILLEGSTELPRVGPSKVVG